MEWVVDPGHVDVRMIMSDCFAFPFDPAAVPRIMFVPCVECSTSVTSGRFLCVCDVCVSVDGVVGYPVVRCAEVCCVDETSSCDVSGCIWLRSYAEFSGMVGICSRPGLVTIVSFGVGGLMNFTGFAPCGPSGAYWTHLWASSV